MQGAPPRGSSIVNNPQARCGSRVVTRKRILIADGHGIIRDGLRVLLEAEQDVTIVGSVATAREAIRLTAALVPDLVIIDPALSAADEPMIVAQLRRRVPAVRTLVLTFQSDDAAVHAALGAGADAYVLKEDSKHELLLAIRAVLAGKMYVSPGITPRIVQGYLSSPTATRERHAATRDSLTAREREVLTLVAEGLRTRDIANALSLSQKTIEKHRANMMRKLNLRTAAAAAAYAIANGLVRP